MTVTPDEQPENPLHPDQPADPEAEPADPPVEPEPEEEPEHIDGEDAEQEKPQESEPSSFALSEAQGKALDKESKSHLTKVKNVLGSQWENVITCPVCDPQLGGFMYDAQLTNPDTAERQVIRDLYAPAPSVTYVQDPDTRTCPKCEGEGETLTGSKNPRYLRKVCSMCKGFGYVPPPGTEANGAFTPDESRELVAVTAGSVPQEDVDAFGHPRFLHDGRENPNFGRMPQFIDPNYP